MSGGWGPPPIDLGLMGCQAQANRPGLGGTGGPPAYLVRKHLDFSLYFTTLSQC